MKKISMRALIAAGLVLSGYSSALADQGSVLRYAIWSNPKGTFHPSLYFTDYDRAIIFNVYSRLVTLDEKQGFKPSLAKSFSFSADGKTLTFDLPTGVKWHDGKPFTSADVAFTYASTARKDYPKDTQAFVKFLEGYEDFHAGKSDVLTGISTPDDHTVSFTFKTPFSGALAHLADQPVLAKHVWEGTPVARWAEATELLRNPVGTGAYKFVEFVPDQYVSLVRNDDYFGGAPKIERLIFKVTNTETAQTALINGEIDIAELSSWKNSDLQLYKSNGIKVIEQTGSSGQYLTLDSTDSRLSDRKVRQAIVHAINRQGIIDSLLNGHGTQFNSNAHPGSPYYPADLNTYPYDPAKAKALLAEAGWKDSDGDGVLDKDGAKFTFTLNFPTGNKNRELSAPIIQQNLKAVGIDAQLISADFNSTLSILQDPKREYDGVLMGGTFRPGRYDNNFWWERFKSDELTKLATTFSSTIDEAVLKSSVGDWLRGINNEAIRVWLYIPNEGYALGKRVTNYTSYSYEPFAGVNNWTVAN